VETNFVGTWTCGFVFNGVKVTQVIKFTNDGRYEGVSKLTGPRGTTAVEDSGTWSVNKTGLVLKSTVTSMALVRHFEPNGDMVDIEMQEVGQTVTFSRAK
jgi:hypothetical protein